MEMNCEPVGGMATRIACGITTFSINCQGCRPSAKPASRWPAGTDNRPARKISLR